MGREGGHVAGPGGSAALPASSPLGHFQGPEFDRPSCDLLPEPPLSEPGICPQLGHPSCPPPGPESATSVSLLRLFI